MTDSEDLVTVRCFNEKCGFEKQVEPGNVEETCRSHEHTMVSPVQEREILVQTTFVLPVKASTHTQALKRKQERLEEELGTELKVRSCKVVDDPGIDTHRNYCSESIVEDGNTGNGQTKLLDSAKMDGENVL